MTGPLHKSMSLDPLTGLADRHQFFIELGGCLARGEAGEEMLGLVFVKAERLRDVNLELSYGEGDELITQLAKRLAGCLRPCDVIARISAAEFAVILPGLKSAGQPLMAVNKMQRICGEPFSIEGRQLRAQLSFGISIGPRDARTREELMRCADVALSFARKTGCDYALYCDCAEQKAEGSIELEHELEASLGAGELDAYYQPIVNLSTGELTGFELMSRWTSPTQGAIDADVSVELAERCGLVMPLTSWMLNTGLRECLQWQPELRGISVSINLPASALTDPDLPELVRQARKIWPTPLAKLTLEVTENAMMSDPQACLETLRQLHKQGVRLSIDGFGTGYSSLAYLKELPVSELKIDGSFVNNMAENEPDRRIVQSVIDLAHNFDLGVVAAGVEGEETLDSLTLMGCELAQGSCIGRAMPFQSLGEWLGDSPWELARALAIDESADELRSGDTLRQHAG